MRFPPISASRAALAYQYYADSLGLPDYWTWNAGVYWTWKETLTVDLRYVGSDLSRSDCAPLMSRGACGNRFMATLSVDTAASPSSPEVAAPVSQNCRFGYIRRAELILPGEKSSMNKMLAEFIGTFTLVLFGCGAAVIAGPAVGATTVGVLGIAFAFGLAIVAMAYGIGPVSGCHVNPAVSLGVWIAGRMTAGEMIQYVIAQCLGAIAGAAVLYLIMSGKASGWDGGLGAERLGRRLSRRVQHGLGAASSRSSRPSCSWSSSSASTRKGRRCTSPALPASRSA